MATRVDIVGGGIAGLTLAALLDPAAFEVTIHEQRDGRPDAYGLGTALGMWPRVRAVLLRIGAGDLLAGAAVPSTGALRLLDGTPCIRLDRAPDVRLIARTDLVRALDEAVPSSVQRSTARIDDVAGLGGEVVVGADGVFSAVRRSTWGNDAAARRTRDVAVRGLVTPRADGDVGEYWGRGRLFGITPVPGGVMNWFCTYPDAGEQELGVAEALSTARERFADACPAVRSVLAEAAPGATLAGPIWVAPPMRSYVRGRVVLIGDAAHAMTPNLGRGACESIVDAVVLAEEMNRRDLADALRAYERRRLVATQAARVASARVAALATARRGAAVRDTMLRVVGRVTGA